MKKIHLTQDKFALVDDDDYEWMSKWKWHAAKRGAVWYAARNGPPPKKHKILMHRVLTFAQPGEEVDHIDGDGLNNQQSNLRRCTSQENKRGFRRKSVGKTSRFRGVSWYNQRKKWHAEIHIRPGVKKHLGAFDSEEEASRAYADAARLHFGAFAAANIFSQELKDLYA